LSVKARQPASQSSKIRAHSPPNFPFGFRELGFRIFWGGWTAYVLPPMRESGHE
jgi:hypothetical protein